MACLYIILDALFVKTSLNRRFDIFSYWKKFADEQLVHNRNRNIDRDRHSLSLFSRARRAESVGQLGCAILDVIKQMPQSGRASWTSQSRRPA